MKPQTGPFRKALQAQRWALAAAVLGGLTFVLLYGVRVLDPTNINWLHNSGSDPLAQNLGWMFYRRSPLRLPYIGMSYSIMYPYRESIVYSDAVPLFAVFFRLLSPLLPGTFQYMGIWNLLSYVLQGFWGQKVLARIGRTQENVVKSIGTLIGAELLVLYPVLAARSFFHFALTGNWLILAALYLWLRASDPLLSTRRSCLWWGAMGALCVSVQVYFLPMAGIILVGFLVRRALLHRPAADLALPVPVYCAAGLATLLVLGAFNSNMSAPATSQLWGADLFNLFVPGYVTTPTDNDTNIYIGAGLVLLVLLGALCLLAALVLKPHWLDRVPAGARDLAISGGVILFLAAFVSISPTVVFAGRHLFTMPLPTFLVRLWSTFRTCGRIAWVIGYLLVTVAGGLLLRLNRPKPALALLAVCLTVQVWNQYPSLASKSSYIRGDALYADPYHLTDPGWQTIIDSGRIRHLVFSSSYCDTDEYWDLCKIAARERWTVNTCYLTHIDYDLLWQTVAGQLADPQPDTLYVFITTEEMRWPDHPLHYYRLDGILIGTVDPLPLPEADLPDPPAYDFVPAEALGPAQDSTAAEQADGALQITAGSASGPGCDLWPGTYEVVLAGSGFDHSYVYSGWHALNQPYNPLDIVWIEGTADRLVFRFTLYEPAPGWDVNIHMLDDTPITVDTFTVTRTNS